MEEEASDFQGLWKTLVRLSKGNSQHPQGQQGRVEERYVTIYSYTNWVISGVPKTLIGQVLGKMQKCDAAAFGGGKTRFFK